MRFWPSKKHVTTIEELLGLVYENQSIFKQLETVDMTLKKERISCYRGKNKQAAKSEEIKKQMMTHFLSNTYALEHLYLTVPIKKYVLKQVSKEALKELALNKTIEFSIRCKQLNMHTVSVFFEHYKKDSIEDVLDYTKAYTSCFLEKKMSTWQKIWNWIKKILRLEKSRTKN
ncbi:hypothetical protein Q4Q35_11900 [Flavivirga aquimarina]|uniref:Uncharacterized protein n=1 Tax=Flavivirga aquimarina TaxID=2027862 RepID=A0ABT8WBJ5_9FLAO|nr:hypothetical protein [Flavivirga aquimarina]MDO5970510.1 hypothetical protein [Flavivirga aquimarina]